MDAGSCSGLARSFPFYLCFFFALLALFQGLLAGSGPAASNFLLLRRKKVTKEKATRSLSPFASLRATLRCSTTEGVWLNSLRCASLKQRQPLSLLRLRCSAQPGRGNRDREREPIPTRTRRGESLFLQVFGFLSSAVRYLAVRYLAVRYAGSPCGCAEERRFRRIRDRVV